MSFVVTLSAFRPPPRYDDVPWTEADVEESAAPDGPWGLLETKPLTPVDADPEAPALRSFTTTLAQLESGWYRIVFRDAAGARSASSAVLGSGESLPPSVGLLRARSNLIRATYPAEPFDAEREATVQGGLEDAIALVESLINAPEGRPWRALDATLTDPRLVRLGVRAVVLKTEQLLTTTAGAKDRRKAIRGVRLRSFTAGPYSESYFGPGEAAQAKVLDPDPALNEVLWALATEAARDYWRALWGGPQRPATAIQQVNWGARRGSYNRPADVYPVPPFTGSG